MRGWHSHLPLGGGTTGRFVMSLVTVLVFTAALAVTVESYVEGLLSQWNRGVSGTLTVQLPVSDASGADERQVVTAVLDVLKAHPAVAQANALPREKTVALLEPWLGSGDLLADLPLPVLIDVTLKETAPEAVNAVSAAVMKAAPAAIIDDHRVWLNRVMNLATGFRVLAWTMMVLIAGALGLTVIFATRASLTEYVQVIEVLHLVGAKDGTIAGQFARRALTQGFSGGVLGLALYAPALGAIAWLASRIDSSILPRVALPPLHWAALAALPIIAGGVAMFTAHLTVRRALAAMV